MPTFYEFFAGGGMARLGLGPGWRCLFANDFDPKKAGAYLRNWGDGEMHTGDVRAISAAELPGTADLAWASFPCQDLSLAGAGRGLNGSRSGTFWAFWWLIERLSADGRAPRAIVLENVCGALTSHQGRDFAAISSAVAGAGYRFGALVVDAEKFVPQSRPRLFVVGVRADVPIPPGLVGADPETDWTSNALARAVEALPDEARPAWTWWRLPAPARRNTQLVDLIEARPEGVVWRSKADTRRLLGLMTDRHRARVDAALAGNDLAVGAVYRRTRRTPEGQKAQRAEVRFDGLAGCLRTPAGGSSRQALLIAENGTLRSRLISAREAARLMGLPDDYRLPSNYNEAYHLIGDGVVAPVVRHIARHILEPILLASAHDEKAA